MKTIGIDSNVLISLRLKRPGYLKAKHYLQQCLAGKLNLFLPQATILETDWVLRSVYKHPKERIIEYFEELLLVPNITSDQKQSVVAALSLYKTTHNVSFTDCVIAQQIHSREYDFLTFDEDLEKLFHSL